MYLEGVLLDSTAYSYVGTAVAYIPANNGKLYTCGGERINFDIY